MKQVPIDIETSVLALKALANAARLRIALSLLDGEQSVGELETSLAIRQPNLSQHLAELRDAGLVTTRRESRLIFYRLADKSREHLVRALLQGLSGNTAPHPAAHPARESRRLTQTARFATVEAS